MHVHPSEYTHIHTHTIARKGEEMGYWWSKLLLNKSLAIEGGRNDPGGEASRDLNCRPEASTDKGIHLTMSTKG